MLAYLLLASPCVGELKLEVRNREFFTVKDFKRIPEFFTGREFSGWKVYCRSNPQVSGWILLCGKSWREKAKITD